MQLRYKILSSSALRMTKIWVTKCTLSPLAYEQAFQLADTDADRSCVLTAMGMLGYTLNDQQGAKAMLLKR